MSADIGKNDEPVTRQTFDDVMVPVFAPALPKKCFSAIRGGKPMKPLSNWRVNGLMTISVKKRTGSFPAITHFMGVRCLP